MLIFLVGSYFFMFFDESIWCFAKNTIKKLLILLLVDLVNSNYYENETIEMGIFWFDVGHGNVGNDIL
jgi:hypothetical protein